MISTNFKAYEGNEPFIFISYAHKDSIFVYQILDKLYEKGYRIWYDDGINSGEEWGQSVAQNLKRSSIVLVFISENMIHSQNCRREVYFAVSNKIQILPIYIKDYMEMPEGLAMQLEITQSIIHNGYSNEDTFIDEVINAIERYKLNVQDYSRSKKPLILNGKVPPEVFLRRDEAIVDFDRFIDNASNKILLLKDVSGAGKSTLLLKYIEETYSWERHGNLIYYSFEYVPYFSSFIMELGRKYFNIDFEESGLDDIINQLLVYWSDHKCTIILDAVEHLFMRADELHLGVVNDTRFLVFLNRALQLPKIKMIISSKVTLSILDSLPQSEVLQLKDIRQEDFNSYLQELKISFSDADLPFLSDVLKACANNMASIVMFANYVIEFNGSSVSRARNSNLLDLENDLKIEQKLFNFYWTQFNEEEKVFVKLLGAVRKEITVSTAFNLMPKECSKISLLSRVKNYLLAEKSENKNGEETISLHSVFKTAIMSLITGTEKIQIHKKLSVIYIDKCTDDLYQYLDNRTERIYHLIHSEETNESIDLLLNRCDGLERPFIDLIYYKGQFPACIELISLLIEKLSIDNGFYAILNRKLAMSLDKNGVTAKSLKHFDSYIQYSKNNNLCNDYIKGIYYKSEPISRLGDYAIAKELVLFAQSEAERLAVFDDRVNSNLKGRYALYCVEQGNLFDGEENIKEALSISMSPTYSFDDKNVINCWWHLILGRLKAKQQKFEEAILELDKSHTLSHTYGYNDFEAEYYCEKCIIAIMKGEEPQEYFEEAINRAADNIYLMIRLQLIKTYMLMLKNPNDPQLPDLIKSIKILLNETKYKQLGFLCDILNYNRHLLSNDYNISAPILDVENSDSACLNKCREYILAASNAIVLTQNTVNQLTNFLKELL